MSRYSATCGREEDEYGLEERVDVELDLEDEEWLLSLFGGIERDEYNEPLAKHLTSHIE